MLILFCTQANDNNLNLYEKQNNGIDVLALWIRMDKRYIQIADLQLRCVSYYYKQIHQWISTISIQYQSQLEIVESLNSGAKTFYQGFLNNFY